MEPGLWIVNERGERIALSTESTEKEGRLKSFLDEETDIERDTGRDRVEMMSKVLVSVLGSPLNESEDEVIKFAENLNRGSKIDSDVIEQAVEKTYQIEVDL